MYPANNYPPQTFVQDRDKPYVLFDDEGKRPFVLMFHGERYELPGEVPVSMVEKAVNSAGLGHSEETMAALQVGMFLTDVCPQGLADALRKSGASTLNRLFEAWSKHVDLGESVAS